MSNESGDGHARPVGELWVELSRDDKKRICDALIDRNQPDLMQEFAFLVRFTRGYLHTQPSGSVRPSQDNPPTLFPSNQGAQPSSVGGNERVNGQGGLFNQWDKKAQLSAHLGSDKNYIWSGPSASASLQRTEAKEQPSTTYNISSTFISFDPKPAAPWSGSLFAPSSSSTASTFPRTVGTRPMGGLSKIAYRNARN